MTSAVLRFLRWIGRGSTEPRQTVDLDRHDEIITQLQHEARRLSEDPLTREAARVRRDLVTRRVVGRRETGPRPSRR